MFLSAEILASEKNILLIHLKTFPENFIVKYEIIFILCKAILFVTIFEDKIIDFVSNYTLIVIENGATLGNQKKKKKKKKL